MPDINDLVQVLDFNTSLEVIRLWKHKRRSQYFVTSLSHGLRGFEKSRAEAIIARYA